MEPLTATIARELLEDIRTNTKLRHRLKMEEGSEASLIEDGSNTIAIETKDGDNFFIQVTQA